MDELRMLRNPGCGLGQQKTKAWQAGLDGQGKLEDENAAERLPQEGRKGSGMEA